MKSLAPPAALPALAALAELTARLTRAADVASIASILAMSAKWIVPVDRVVLIARDRDRDVTAWPAGTPIDATGALASTLSRTTTTRAPTTAEAGLTGVAPDHLAWLVIALTDGDSSFGAMALGVRNAEVLETIDGGLCHLLALNVGSARSAAATR
jgi:hypothetical protein